MRLKFKKALLAAFDLMIILVTNKSIIISKLKNKSIIREFQYHEQFVSHKCNHEIKSCYAQVANN